MPWAAVGAIGGALIASNAAGNAADAAQQQNQANINAQLGWNQMQDPFSAGGNRAQYVSQLNNLMQGGYQWMQQDPMFQWMLGQGREQAQRAGSVTGQGGSGAEQIALQQQGFGLANQFFNQQYNRLADLSGASRGGGAAAIGQSPGDAFSQQMGVGQTYTNAFGTGLGGLRSLYGSMRSGYNSPSYNTNTQSSSGEYLGDPMFR